MPPAMTAMVPLSSDPSCAALSMPAPVRTRPRLLRCPRSCASPRAKRQAAALALRAPTMATIGRSSSDSCPSRSGAAAHLRARPAARIEALTQHQVASASRSTASISRSALSCGKIAGSCRRHAGRDREWPPAPPARCRSEAAGDRRSDRSPACGSAAAGRPGQAAAQALPHAAPSPRAAAGYSPDASRSRAARSQAASETAPAHPISPR